MRFRGSRCAEIAFARTRLGAYSSTRSLSGLKGLGLLRVREKKGRNEKEGMEGNPEESEGRGRRGKKREERN